MKLLIGLIGYYLGDRKKLMSRFGELRVAPAAVAQSAKPFFQNIALRHVTHAYFHERDERMFRLGPINLSFVPGQLTFIVGGNGSGKTTLAKIITGLYEPEQGTITVDGKNVDFADRDGYRQNFSAVFTDFHLFDELRGLRDADAGDTPRSGSRGDTGETGDADQHANALLAKLAIG